MEMAANQLQDNAVLGTMMVGDSAGHLVFLTTIDSQLSIDSGS
jgi:hypothetical protein